MESLHIDDGCELLNDGNADTTLLAQLLMAATAAPLHYLSIGFMHHWDSAVQVMQCIGQLKQVRELELSIWDLTEACQLSGLHSLQARLWPTLHPRLFSHLR